MDNLNKEKILVLVVVCGLMMSLLVPQTQALSYPINQSANPATGSQLMVTTTRKIMVDNSDTSTLEELAKNNANLLADYGAFSLWRVSDKQAGQVQSRATVAIPTDLDSLQLRNGTLNTALLPSNSNAATKLAPRDSSSYQLWMVQFIGPLKNEWLDKLRNISIELVSYLPNNAYVVWLNGPQLTALQNLATSDSTIQWIGAYDPAYRLSPTLQHVPANTNVKVTVQFYHTAVVQASIAQLKSSGLRVFSQPAHILNFDNISLEIPATQLNDIASWPDVFNVEPWFAFHKLDETQDQIIAGKVITSSGTIVPNTPGTSYLNWLNSKGFPTNASSYPIIDVIDYGIDNGSANTAHVDFHNLGISTTNSSRVVFNNNCTTDTKSNDTSGHGTLMAGIIGGFNNKTTSPYQDANGYNLGLGVSPYGQIGGTKIFNSSFDLDETSCGGNDRGVIAAAYTAGANITNNSYGANVDPLNDYDTAAQTFDALTRDASSNGTNHQILHIFAAGNGGPNPTTIASPGTAKNVLTVGATESVRDNGVTDGCGNSIAGNPDNIAAFSAHGPTLDGRIKPDILAPGIHVQAQASQDPSYNGAANCDLYYPAGQTLYSEYDGTSVATAGVSGAASLAYNYYNRVINVGQNPSPAMLKALLLNSPRYLSNATAGGNLPSPKQGWGAVNLGQLFDNTPYTTNDQTVVFNATGQTYVEKDQVVSITKPVRISLVWTDAPGSPTGGKALVNDLDLKVQVGAQIYKGNVFSGGTSVTGGSFDSLNNVESVFLPVGTSGNFTVTVTAANIAGKADTTLATNNQDFALLVYNDIPSVPSGISKLSVNTGNLQFTAAGQQTLNLVSSASPIKWTSKLEYTTGAGNWLTMNTTQGTALAVSGQPLIFTANPAGLASGVYTAKVSFINDSNGQVDATVLVGLTVKGYSYYLPNLANASDGYTSQILLQNIGNTSANLQMQYYNATGAALGLNSSGCSNLAANSRCAAPNPLAVGAKGAGLISSDQPLAIIVTERTPYGNSAYAVKAGASQELIAPLAINQNGGFRTKLTVFNADASPTTARVTFYDQQGNLLPAATKNLNLAPYTQQTLDQTASDSQLSVGYYGWARISGQSGSKIVAQISEERPDIRFVSLSAAQSITNQKQAAIGAVFNHAFGSFVTGANIVNPNANPVDVNIVYYDYTGRAYPAQIFSVPANAIVPVYHGSDRGQTGLPNAGLPAGFYGSAIVTTTGGGGDVIVAVNVAGSSPTGGPVESGTYAGVALSGEVAGTGSPANIGLPLMANAGSNGFTTGATIFNASAATVSGNITYYASDGTRVGSPQSFSIEAYTSLPLYQGATGVLPAGFYGQAIVTQNGSNYSNALLVTVNALSNDVFFTYSQP